LAPSRCELTPNDTEKKKIVKFLSQLHTPAPQNADWLWSLNPPIQCEAEVNWLRCEAHHSTEASAEITNGMAIPPLPIHL